LRADRFDECATVLQKNIRRSIYRHRYLRTQKAILGLQCLVRQRLAKNELHLLQKEKAALLIQTQFRRFSARKEYVSKMDIILKLQRGMLSQ
jgi:myosin-5